MICHNNLAFSILYRGDLSTLHAIVSDSARRLGAPFQVPWDMQLLRCLWVLLLDRDIELKNHLLVGTPFVGPIDPRKAEAFFLALRPEIIERWLRDERMTPDDLVSGARGLYLCA